MPKMLRYCILVGLKKNSIVVAVSGGADSLALSALTKFNQYNENNKYFYYQ